MSGVLRPAHPRDPDGVQNPLSGVSRETKGRLEHYLRLLDQWQKRINLVSATTLEDGWSRHIVDSARFFHAAPDATSWSDIGSGAGFPGLVIAHLLADRGITAQMHLVESNSRKCAFLRTIIRETGLNVSSVETVVHCGRIDAVLPQLPILDIICARALAPLTELLMLCEDRLGVETMGLFAKGAGHESELQAAREAWSFEVATIRADPHAGSVLLGIGNLKKSGQAPL